MKKTKDKEDIVYKNSHSNNCMLHISNLEVFLDAANIIKNVQLTIVPGTIHAIMGPNGSGKSTLAATIVGHPAYAVKSGSIYFNGHDITKLSPDKRARLGIFLAFQQPPVIPGVSVISFLKEAHYAITGKQVPVKEFQDLVHTYMALLQLDHACAYRSLHDGFSGGERKRLELLQLLILQPKLAILDEIDSGLDIDGLKIIGQALQSVRKEQPKMSIILITHNQRTLHYIQPDHVHILCDGSFVASGGVQLVDELERRGYNGYRKGAAHHETI